MYNKIYFPSALLLRRLSNSVTMLETTILCRLQLDACTPGKSEEVCAHASEMHAACGILHNVAHGSVSARELDWLRLTYEEYELLDVDGVNELCKAVVEGEEANV